jgi:hypothetical protein
MAVSSLLWDTLRPKVALATFVVLPFRRGVEVVDTRPAGDVRCGVTIIGLCWWGCAILAAC